MKTRRILFVLFILLIALLSTLIVSAHSGRTDSNGGHYDEEAGEYHYHHGYPAHYHTNGKCPYDYDDKTNHNFGNNSDFFNNDSSNSTRIDSGVVILFIIIGSIALFLLGSFVWYKISTKNSFDNNNEDK